MAVVIPSVQTVSLLQTGNHLPSGDRLTTGEPFLYAAGKLEMHVAGKQGRGGHENE